MIFSCNYFSCFYTQEPNNIRIDAQNKNKDNLLDNNLKTNSIQDKILDEVNISKKANVITNNSSNHKLFSESTKVPSIIPYDDLLSASKKICYLDEAGDSSDSGDLECKKEKFI